ncbi:PAS domain-containing sensor histidine kinase [Candidatus Saccharibacteria bacterium]|nr:PAS domain-containing sensor histidine kinase [Candidatus Saccharibacteria bacterium]
MGIFDKFTKNSSGAASVVQAPDKSAMAEMALEMIDDGVMILDNANKVQFINPAGVAMVGYSSPNEVLNAGYLSLIRLENGEGMAVPDDQNPLAAAILANECWSSKNYVLVTIQGKKTPVEITLTFSGRTNKIITLRNITKELEEEGEQTEFISTASHEMRTPVASIEGYLGLALNPATATIDDRARQYLNEAHAASQHLGRLFRDLLDVTKLDDKRMKVHMVPVEMTEEVKRIADAHTADFASKNLKYSFGTFDEVGDNRVTMDQLIYALVDVDFLKEILDNLIENAVKYTPEGGAVWINVRGDGDRALINVTDTGMGIAPDDLSHIFQKFYRVDNSQTRTIGGTGLGLYIVKQRVEAMGGRVWAESAFGEGSTFYVSLPRISPQEYERQKQVLANTAAMEGSNQMNAAAMAAAPALGQAAVIGATPPAAAPAPVASPTAAPDMSPEKLAEAKTAFQQSVASQQQP